MWAGGGVCRLLAPAVVAMKREMNADFKANVRKFLPLLRNPLYDLHEAAKWLEDWLDGTLSPTPLLDVQACLC